MNVPPIRYKKKTVAGPDTPPKNRRPTAIDRQGCAESARGNSDIHRPKIRPELWRISEKSWKGLPSDTFDANNKEMLLLLAKR